MPHTNASTGESNSDSVAGLPDNQHWKDVEERMASFEGQLGALATDPRIGSALVRAAELEKKVSDGTSDPILNEVAHRWTALEGQPTAPDKDITDRLATRLDDLAGKISSILATDPRTDDLVIRTASLEAATKKTAEADHLSEVTQRVEQLEAAVQDEDSEQLASLDARLARVENASAQEPADPRVDTLITRLFDLEEQLQKSSPASEIEELVERVSSLQAKAERSVQDEQLAQIASRVHSLEEAAGAVPPDPRVENLVERLADLEHLASSTQTDSRLGEVTAQLSTLEERLEQPADNSRWDELGERLADLLSPA